MSSIILIVGGVTMLAEGIRWTRRMGITTTQWVVLGLCIALPLVDLFRVAWWIGSLIAEWIVGPALAHARWRFQQWRARRNGQETVETVVRAALPPPPPLALPPAAAIPARPVFAPGQPITYPAPLTPGRSIPIDVWGMGPDGQVLYQETSR